MVLKVILDTEERSCQAALTDTTPPPRPRKRSLLSSSLSLLVKLGVNGLELQYESNLVLRMLCWDLGLYL
ncbi:hypothetical protein QQP08_022906 [Theobroma cacao]|nr:hypothetical protein QQP08_022906 [Theobroma cacao]